MVGGALGCVEIQTGGGGEVVNYRLGEQQEQRCEAVIRQRVRVHM